MSYFDLVLHRVQSEGQKDISYILVVFGGAHSCLMVHVCVYGVCIEVLVLCIVYQHCLQMQVVA